MSNSINTQGLTAEASNSPLTRPNIDPFNYPIRDIPKRTIFTPEERMELKAIIKECLREFHYTTT